jgi:hypothetical protein
VLFVDHDATIPGVHLFDFDTLVRYRVCPGGTVDYLGSDATGLVDHGVAFGTALELAGFEFLYQPSNAPVGDIDPNPLVAKVPITGRFYVEFDWAGVVGSFAIGKTLELIGKPLVKLLKAQPPSRWKSIVLADVQRAIQGIEARLGAISGKLQDLGVPKIVADALAAALKAPVQLALAAWKQGIENEELTVLTADQVGNVVTTLFQADVLQPVPFDVWTPAVIHEITATSASGFDQGWHNPFLAVLRVRNVVVT